MRINWVEQERGRRIELPCETVAIFLPRVGSRWVRNHVYFCVSFKPVWMKCWLWLEMSNQKSGIENPSEVLISCLFFSFARRIRFQQKSAVGISYQLIPSIATCFPLASGTHLFSVCSTCLSLASTVTHLSSMHFTMKRLLWSERWDYIS